MMETWKPVVDWEGLYEVSDAGRIRSIARINPRNKQIMGGGLIKPIMGSRKYLVINLSKTGQRKQYFVHKLVLEAFISKRPEGCHACHNDGNTVNNQLNNLRWDTVKNNHSDKKKHGTHQYGERIGNSKLTEDIVRYIRQNKLKPCEARNRFKLSKTNSKKIVNGETWKHIQI